MVFTRVRAHAHICMKTQRKACMHETMLYAVFRAPYDFYIRREGQETICIACFRVHCSNSFESVILSAQVGHLGFKARSSRFG